MPGTDHDGRSAVEKRWTTALFWSGVAIMAVAYWTGEQANTASVEWFVAGSLVHGALYLLAVFALYRCPDVRLLLGIVIGVALALRVAGFLTPHDGLTTDAYRYVWDGRIQWSGFNPYALVPADPVLAALRDDAVYPLINQKDTAVTIYPPVAQILFAAANAISDTVTGPKVVMALADLGIIAALLVLLPLAGLPRTRVLLYAWHPLPIWEFTSQAHIDAAATLLVVLALLAAWSRRAWLVGALLAFAVLTKVFPLVLAPALYRRWDWRMPVAGLVAIAVVCLPYVLTGGGFLTGNLSSHLDLQGYAAGWGFHPVWLLRDFGIGDMSGRAYVALAIAVLAVLALWAMLQRPPDVPEVKALLLLAIAFVWLTSPHYPWYFAWIVPLIALHASPVALAMTLLAPVLYWPRPPGGASWTELYAIVYYLPLAIGFAVYWIDRRGAGLRGDR